MTSKRRFVRICLVLLILGIVLVIAVMVYPAPNHYQPILDKLNAMQFPEPATPPIDALFETGYVWPDSNVDPEDFGALLENAFSKSFTRPYLVEDVFYLDQETREAMASEARYIRWTHDAGQRYMRGRSQGRDLGEKELLWGSWCQMYSSEIVNLLSEDIYRHYRDGDVDTAFVGVCSLFTLAESIESNDTGECPTQKSCYSRKEAMYVLEWAIGEELVPAWQLDALRSYAKRKMDRNSVRSELLDYALPAPSRAERIQGAKYVIASGSPLLSYVPPNERRGVSFDWVRLVGDRREDQSLARYYQAIDDLITLSFKECYLSKLIQVSGRDNTFAGEHILDLVRIDRARRAGWLLFQQLETESDFRMMYIAASVELFRQARGELPASLEELGTEIPLDDRMLTDPFSCEPIDYYIEKDRFVLYCTGFSFMAIEISLYESMHPLWNDRSRPDRIILPERYCPQHRATVWMDNLDACLSDYPAEHIWGGFPSERGQQDLDEYYKQPRDLEHFINSLTPPNDIKDYLIEKIK